MVSEHDEAGVIVANRAEEGEDAIVGVAQHDVSLGVELEDEVVFGVARAEGKVDRAVGAELVDAVAPLAAEVHAELHVELARGVRAALARVRRGVKPSAALEEHRRLLALAALRLTAAAAELEKERALVVQIVDVRQPRPEYLATELSHLRGDVERVELLLRHRARTTRRSARAADSTPPRDPRNEEKTRRGLGV